MVWNLSRLGMIAIALAITGCAQAPKDTVDYSAFRASKPASILILPPLNASVDPSATASVLAQATLPLAESGYYVVPVGVMTETFHQNGITTPEDAHQIPAAKLREIFGADAALYMTVTQYGSSYHIVASATTVSLEATLIDLRSGKMLWEGKESVAHTSDTSGGLLGMLIQAVVEQVINSVTDRSVMVAAQTNHLLLMSGRPNGMLPGPRSPLYEFK